MICDSDADDLCADDVIMTSYSLKPFGVPMK